MIGGSLCECLGGYAACGLLRKDFPQSSDLSQPKRVSGVLRKTQFEHVPGQVDLIADQQNISGTKDLQQVLPAKGPEKLTSSCDNQDYQRKRCDTDFNGQKPVHTLGQHCCHDGISFIRASIEQTQSEQRIGATEQQNTQCEIQNAWLVPIKQKMMFIDCPPTDSAPGTEIAVQESSPKTITSIYGLTSFCKQVMCRSIVTGRLFQRKILRLIWISRIRIDSLEST